MIFKDLSNKQAPKRKKKLGTYRSGVVLLSVSLSLTIIGILVSLLFHANALITQVKHDVELHVYLESNLNDANKTKLQDILSSYPFINKEASSPIEYKSQQQLTNTLIEKKYITQDFDKILGYNPIRPCFVLKIREEYANESKLTKISNQLSEITGVYEVDLSSQHKKDLTVIVNNLNLILAILLGFTVITFFTVSILINNTIKLALFSQRFLIRSMQLVGAEKSFIKKPFLKNSAIQGLIGGSIAAGITFMLIRYAYSKMDNLSMLLNNTEIAAILGGLVVTGTILGIISSYFALNKYLKLSLDDLY